MMQVWVAIFVLEISVCALGLAPYQPYRTKKINMLLFAITVTQTIILSIV